MKGIGLWPYSRPRAQFFPIRTSRPANNIYIFIRSSNICTFIYSLVFFTSLYRLWVYYKQLPPSSQRSWVRIPFRPEKILYVPASDWGYFNQPIKLPLVKVNHMCEDFIPILEWPSLFFYRNSFFFVLALI